VAVSGFFAYLVAAMQGKYYLEIITPGALVALSSATRLTGTKVRSREVRS